MHKFSIIMPVYNAEKYLKECLESIINQTYSNLEIICINDGSIDNSLTILEKYSQKDTRIIIINQQNQGVSVARNNGINKATGDYILFVDADDYLNINACENLAKQIELDNNFDVLCFNFIGIQNNIYRQYDVVSKINNSDKLTLLHNGSSASWNKLYRTSFLENCNIAFIQNIPVAEDAIFWFTLVYYGCKVRTIPNYLYYYREDSYNSVTNKWKKFLELNIYAYTKMKETKLYQQMSSLEQLVITDFFGKCCFSIWSGLPQKEYQKEYNKLIEQFADNYKSFNYNDYKNLIGYKRIKYRYWVRILKRIRDLYFSVRYRRF